VFITILILQLYCNLGSSLRKLLGESNDTFWRTGWVFARVQQSVAFLYNGLFSLILCCVNIPLMWLQFFSILKNLYCSLSLFPETFFYIIFISCISPAGQVVLDVPLCLKSPHHCTISCIKPLAVPASATAHFIVKGCNLSQTSTR